MQARDIMSKNVVTIGEDRPLSEAGNLLLKHHITGLPVVNAKGGLVGIISERDLLLRHELIEHVVDVMTRDVITVGESTSLTAIVEILLENQIKRVPVLRGERPVGIVSRSDALRGQIAEATASSETQSVTRG